MKSSKKQKNIDKILVENKKICIFATDERNY